MELRDYQLFLRLAETLHFSRAARAEGLSASALTRRIQAMEEELGHQVLIRDHREIRLTAAGQRFRVFAHSQLAQWEELENDLKDEASAPTGTLNLACTVTAAHTVLPTLLSRYRERYPGVTLRLITQDATRSMNQLEAGEVDLAVIPTEEPPPEQLATVTLGRTELSFIAPESHAEWREALSQPCPQWDDIPLVAPLSGLERKRLLDYLRAERAEPHIVAEVRGNEGIIAMVSLGGGVGLVPNLVLQTSPLRHGVRELTQLSPPPGYNVSLCTRRRNLERRVVGLFFELARESLEDSQNGDEQSVAESLADKA